MSIGKGIRVRKLWREEGDRDRERGNKGKKRRERQRSLLQKNKERKRKRGGERTTCYRGRGYWEWVGLVS